MSICMYEFTESNLLYMLSIILQKKLYQDYIFLQISMYIQMHKYLSIYICVCVYIKFQDEHRYRYISLLTLSYT